MQFILTVKPIVTVNNESKNLENSIVLININEIVIIDINQKDKDCLIFLKDKSDYRLSPEDTERLLKNLNSSVNEKNLVCNPDMSEIYKLLKE